MVANLLRRWWVFLVRGLCSIFIGVVAFTQPVTTLLTLVIVWGILALVDGITALFAGWAGRGRGEGMMPFLIGGVISILAGLTAWLWPGITVVALLTIIAVWSIVRGLFEIMGAIALRREIEHEWLMVGSGVLSVLFGVVLLSRPGAGIVTLAYFIGIYAFLSGVMLVFLGFKLRGLAHRFA
jgi:uncharacterized membrane protein HdeD (DUF308 family)